MAFETVLDRLLSMVQVTTRLRDTYSAEIEDLQLALDQVLVALKLTLEDGPGHDVTDALQLGLARLNQVQYMHDAVENDAMRRDEVLRSLQGLLWSWPGSTRASAAQALDDLESPTSSASRR